MHSFEDKIQEIEIALERKRSKWDLDAVAYIDYDDIKQIIMTHIYKKWHLWDQSKSVEPWLNRVVSNQFKNLLRNHYGNFVRPCLRCEFNNGGDGCSKTRSGIQESSCAEYKQWEQKKKSAYDIKLAVTMENHSYEMKSKQDTFLDLEEATKKLTNAMRPHLNDRLFQAFKMLFVQNKSDEEVAKYLGFKTNEKKRSAGYKQIKNLKKIFHVKAKQILEEKDIL
jgi:RNA polymerase sigma factor (sigma-70 family)|tara:strand:+ start:490 stop:1161 length:672 start_codon:yes stop_codon:yes gene_type:complete